MAQRYICTEPAMGANFYQTYAPAPNLNGTPTYGGPDQVSQQGTFPGYTVNGHFNTRWMWVTTAVNAPVIVPGTQVVINGAPGATQYMVIAGAPGSAAEPNLNGTPVVASPVSNAANQGVGLWVEISDAPLNLTPMGANEDDIPPGEPAPPEVPSEPPGRQRPPRASTYQGVPG